VIGTIASIAPTLGPIIGGWITDTLGWRWLFYVNLVPGLAVAAGVALLVDIDSADLKLLKGGRLSGHSADGAVPGLPRVRARGGRALETG
jgi:DHA2 family multidrug resistance protein